MIILKVMPGEYPPSQNLVGGRVGGYIALKRV